MAEQVRKHKETASETRGGVKPSATLSERGKQLKRSIDQLVDDIDDILEENADEFVKEYVQRGGE